MATFAIKAVYLAEHGDSRRLIGSLTRSGAHFLTRAQWACEEGEHTALLWVEADCEDEARLVVPPIFRRGATVTRVSG